MIRHYLIIAWRNLMKRKFYSAVMILGLGVGLAFALIIGSFVYLELQVNKQIKDLESHYLLTSKWAKPNMGLELTTLGPLAQTLKEKYPNLIKSSYSFDAVSAIVQKEDKVFNESLQLGDQEILEMFGFPLLHGSPETALKEPNSLVIPDFIALKYFGTTDVLNEVLTVESFSGQRKDFEITGVLATVPTNSVTHLVYDKTPILMSKESLRFFNRYSVLFNWNNAYVANYIQLHDGVVPEDLVIPIRDQIKLNATEEITANLTVEPKPLSSLYLSFNDGYVRKSLRILILVSVFILLMAIVNFINITVGNATERLKEIGVRKVMGSSRSSVAFQLLTEITATAILSLSFAFLIYHFSRPFFEEILGKSLLPLTELPTLFFMSSIMLTLIIGIISGLYPALKLSAISSAYSLKNSLPSLGENIVFRRILLASQFAISFFVLAGTLLIVRQINYLSTKDLGYKKENIVYVRTPRDWSSDGVNRIITVRNELLKISEVKESTLAFEIPDGQAGFNTGIYRQGRDSTSAIFAPMLQTDERFLATYDIELLHGRYFSKVDNSSLQENEVVINEATAYALEFENPADAINGMVNVSDLGGLQRIVGVVKDFHFTSMHEAIKPIVISNVGKTTLYRFLAFRLNAYNTNRALAALEQKWKELLPNAPFAYEFLDVTLQSLYRTEYRLKKAAQVSSLLSLIIVVIGVLGLVSISLVRRTKEIGIRRVLGAQLVDINWLFMKEFVAVSAISMILAVPFFILLGERWLENFAYRVPMNYVLIWGLILFFFLLLIGVVFLQAFQKIRMNPSESLRSE